MDMNKKVSLCCIFYETGIYFGMAAWCRRGTNIGMIPLKGHLIVRWNFSRISHAALLRRA